MKGGDNVLVGEGGGGDGRRWRGGGRLTFLRVVQIDVEEALNVPAGGWVGCGGGKLEEGICYLALHQVGVFRVGVKVRRDEILHGESHPFALVEDWVWGHREWGGWERGASRICGRWVFVRDIGASFLGAPF